MNSAHAAKRKLPLHVLISLALVFGAIFGIIAQNLYASAEGKPQLEWFNKNISDNIGGIFITLIFCIVVPLLFSALVNGVAEIGDATKIGRAGIRALGLTIVMSSIAVGIGLTAVNLAQPANGLSTETRAKLEQTIADKKEESIKKASIAEVTVEPPLFGMIPRNPLVEATRALTGGILPLMVFALLFGIALATIPVEQGAPVKAFMESLFAVCQRFVEIAMKFAPIGVFFLVFKAASTLGIDALLVVGKYAILVLVALAIHFFLTYPLVLKLIAKTDPLVFFKRMKTVILTAFATSSSNATLPIALKSAEEDLGLPKNISNFVLTVGATANQNGTALFEGITILFLCGFYGVTLDFGQQLTVMGLAIVAGIGTAGVPGGAWPMIGVILARFGVPIEAIGICIGIDRILDMSRTVLNVVGDMVIAASVSTMEGAHPSSLELLAEAGD